MCYFKEKSAYVLFIFLILAIFIARPQFVYSQEINFDKDPPYIVETSPEDGDTGVPVNSKIEVLFNEIMDTFFTPFSIDPDIDGQLEWETDQTLIFAPDMLLDYGAIYQVTIDTQATDFSGNSLENPYQWSFTTEPLPWLNFYEIQGLSLDQNPVKLILGDVNGDIWVVLSSPGTSDDLFVFNGFDPSDFYKIDESFGQINAIEQDGAGNIWIASEDPNEGGVHVFDGMDWTHYNSNTYPDFSDNSMLCLTADSTDNIWVGSLYSGIYRFDGTAWTNYNANDHGLSNNWVISIEADDEDNIWFATAIGGPERYDPQADEWTSYTSAIEDKFNIDSLVVGEIISGSGNIWATSGYGLLRYNIASEQWELFTQIDGYNQLNSISFDPSSGILWVGTDTGLISFDGMSGESIIMGNVGPEVLETSIDAYGNVWIGTGNSLSRYDTAPPVLLSFSPGANKKDVSRSTKITLIFNEPMNMDSVIDALSFTPSVSFTSSIKENSTKLIITPKSNLNDNKKYTVTVDETATDIQGHPLAKKSWSFTTEKAAPPAFPPSFPSMFPSTGFGFPSTGFGNLSRFFPSTGFGFPSTGFGFPSTGFGFPSTGFGNLSRFFPSTGFGFPSTRFGFPSTGFGFPSTGFGNLSRFFPSRGFGFPSTGFGNLSRFFPSRGFGNLGTF